MCYFSCLRTIFLNKENSAKGLIKISLCKNIFHRRKISRGKNNNFGMVHEPQTTQKQSSFIIVYGDLLFFPIFTRFAYQNDFLNLGEAILLLVAVALYDSHMIFFRDLQYSLTKISRIKEEVFTQLCCTQSLELNY